MWSRHRIELLETRVLLSAITSGETKIGSLAAGEAHTYTFPAKVGDSLSVAMGEESFDEFNEFSPEVELLDPNAKVVASNTSLTGTVIDYRPTQNGTYTIIARDDDEGVQRPGRYRLTLVKVPGNQATGGDGGSLVAGQQRSGKVGLGDLDVFMFQAVAGDSVTVGMGETVPDQSRSAPPLYGGGGCGGAAC